MAREFAVSARVALVTGCGKETGIGRAVAMALSRRGAAVVVSDVADHGVDNLGDDGQAGGGLSGLVRDVIAAAGTASLVVGDISSHADAADMVAQTLDEYGRLDILVNNASAPHGREYGEIEEVPVDAWETTMAVNLRGTFLMCRAAVAAMRPQHWGRIVNISSVAGRMGVPKRAAYSASKAGILGLTRSLAVDLARWGVTVNAVCPGPILTTRTLSNMRRQGAQDSGPAIQARGAQVPVGRMGTPEDVAHAVAFLAADDSGFITGQALNVDGGMLIA